jgi:hypothetical protein
MGTRTGTTGSRTGTMGSRTEGILGADITVGMVVMVAAAVVEMEVVVVGVRYGKWEE